jgi:hypothetical protein
MRHFHYDPFTTLGGKENCTVGALRSQAVGHDVSIKARNMASIGKRGKKAVDLVSGLSGRR